MVDEIDKSLQEDFPVTNGYPFPWTWLTIDWTPYPMYESAIDFMIRVTGRMLLGISLCILPLNMRLMRGRNKEYRRTIAEHDQHVVIFSMMIGRFPRVHEIV